MLGEFLLVVILKTHNVIFVQTFYLLLQRGRGERDIGMASGEGMVKGVVWARLGACGMVRGREEGARLGHG
jgi:hypothetical protein